jgi:hypothetical protein
MQTHVIAHLSGCAIASWPAWVRPASTGASASGFDLDLNEGVNMNELNLKSQQPVEPRSDAQRADLEEIQELNLEELRSVAGGPQIINEA